MALFDSNRLLQYAAILTVLGVVTYFGKQIQHKISGEDPEAEYAMVKQYLLNDSVLFGNNKPKIWIHSKYEVNSRKWRDFGSRNTTDLNQPYMHLTIQSIIHHCSQEFHILLIDDDSFSKLLDDWTVDVANMPEPQKTHWRQYGIAKLIWKYGGMTIPNSFVCLKSLKKYWLTGIESGKPFVSEMPNHTARTWLKTRFIPDIHFMGCGKTKSEEMGEFLEFLHKRCMSMKHASSVEGDFHGDVQNWLAIAHKREIFEVLPGELVGVKTALKREPILLEDWMGEKPVNLSVDCCGIYIPEDEILKRPKYQWFAALNTLEILQSNMILSMYIRKATMDSMSEYNDESSMKMSLMSGI